jgi:hypothetical protein
MKRRLFQKTFLFLTFVFAVNSNSQESSFCSVKDYQDFMKHNYSCDEVEIKTKLSKQINDKNIKKFESKNLLSWLKEMKEIWRDFPVYRQMKINSKSATNIKYLEPCKYDKIGKLEKGLIHNENGSLEGTGVLTFDGKGSSCFSKLGVHKINGTFANGQLDGMATVYFNNGSFLRAPFLNGAISGLARTFSCQYGACDFDYEAWNKPNRLSEVINMN